MTRIEKLRCEQWLIDDPMERSSIWHVLISSSSYNLFFCAFPHLLLFTPSLPTLFNPLLPLNPPPPPMFSVLRKQRGGRKRKHPNDFKGLSWVVGRWGIFLALWCPFKHSTWRWAGAEGRGCSHCIFLNSLLHMVNIGIHVLLNCCLCLNRCLSAMLKMRWSLSDVSNSNFSILCPSPTFTFFVF